MTRGDFLINLHPGTILREDYLVDIGWFANRSA